MRADGASSRLVRTLAAAGLAWLASCGGAAAQSAGTTRAYHTEVSTLATRPGSLIRAVYWRARPGPDSAGVAVILFAGGNGMVRIAANGSVGGLTQNFLIRSREHFIDAGVDFVAVIDTPSDRQQGLNGTFRLSATHADDVSRVIEDVRTRSKLPVWLVGTSAGTLSAANVGVRLNYSSGEVAGLVLTSPITSAGLEGRCGKTLADVNLGFFRGPVLVVAHREDGCECTPAAQVDQLLAAFVNSPRREKRLFTGGDPPLSKPCEARSQHGFLGIEDQVVRGIVDWIKTTPR